MSYDEVLVGSKGLRAVQKWGRERSCLSTTQLGVSRISERIQSGCGSKDGGTLDGGRGVQRQHTFLFRETKIQLHDADPDQTTVQREKF